MKRRPSARHRTMMHRLRVLLVRVGVVLGMVLQIVPATNLALASSNQESAEHEAPEGKSYEAIPATSRRRGARAEEAARAAHAPAPSSAVLCAQLRRERGPASARRPLPFYPPPRKVLLRRLN